MAETETTTRDATASPAAALRRAWFAYAALAAALLLVVHRGAWAPALRHSRVAEGNISHVVHDLWARGPAAWRGALRDDALLWGRVRPAHWLFHSVPFALTLLRNGDLRAADASTRLADRINGDLQTHTLWLLLVLALAAASLGAVIRQATGSFAAGALTACASGLLPSIRENLLVNYCDGGEIAQLLWIGLYLLSVAAALADGPDLRREALGAACLFLAYATKETSLVLAPAAVLLFGRGAWRRTVSFPLPARFCRRQLAAHAAAAAALLVAVLHFRHGRYASNYGGAAGGLLPHVRFAWAAIRGPPDWLGAGVAGLGLLGWFFASRRLRPRAVAAGSAGRGALLLAVAALAAGFWAIQIPWRVELEKYFLPAAFFGSAAAVGGAFLAARAAREAGARGAARLWAAGFAAFLAAGVPSSCRSAAAYYRRSYGYREAVPVVAGDVASEAARLPAGRPFRAVIVAGSLFQEGGLPFDRYLNRAFGVNVVRDGAAVSAVPACERNYLRVRAGAPGAELRMTDAVRDDTGRGADAVYAYDGFCRGASDTALRANGFDLAGVWELGGRMRLVKYARGEAPDER